MKKWILITLTAACVVFGALGLAACVPGNLQDHVWEWDYNSTTHWRKCTVDGCNLTKDEGEHDWEVISVSVYPTCTSTGKGEMECKVCHAKTTTIPKTDHSWALKTTYKEATCLENGSAEYECQNENCHLTETRDIPALGDHDFNSGKYVSAGDQGHYALCKYCDEPSDVLEPHQETVSGRMNPTDIDDGWVDWKCSDCQNVRRAVTENTNLPNEINVNIRRKSNSRTVTMTDYRDGKKVSLLPSGDGDGVIYEVTFTASRDGKNSQPAKALLDFYDDEGKGVWAYYRDDNARETKLDVGNTGELFLYGNGTSIYTANLRVRNSGSYCIVFKYETGRIEGQTKVRATFTLYIECSNTAPVSALELQPGGIDDGIICLATGAYESKYN